MKCALTSNKLTRKRNSNEVVGYRRVGGIIIFNCGHVLKCEIVSSVLQLYCTSSAFFPIVMLLVALCLRPGMANPSPHCYRHACTNDIQVYGLCHLAQGDQLSPLDVRLCRGRSSWMTSNRRAEVGGSVVLIKFNLVSASNAVPISRRQFNNCCSSTVGEGDTVTPQLTY